MKKVLLFLFFPVLLTAQEDSFGNWVMYFGTNKVSENWSIHSEVQYRSYTFGLDNTSQLLLRTGANYHLSPTTIITAGYGYIASYPFEQDLDLPTIEEHRIFQQLISKGSIAGKIGLEHRYRFEQRFIEDDFKTRWRYRILATVPLNKPSIQKGAFFAAIYDEIFVNTDGDLFGQNRLYGGFGYQAQDNLQFQMGILNLRVQSFDTWNFQVAMVYNLDFTTDTSSQP